MDRRGKVILVGAGPGDPGLLTVKGKEMLEKADVVVYDRLIAGDFMEYLPEGTELIYVGKEQGRHPIPQHEINAILAREAGAGKVVVRLKGGDPFVFGRGAEELELLRQQGLDFEVVPGVTSAISALAYAGIPATHRDYASSLHIITGHAREDGALEIDYDALIRIKGTLVFLMGVSTMGQIVEGLTAAGMPADTPAAVVENGTLPTQRSLQCTLGEVVGRAQELRISSPAILAVGGVCGCRGLDWFGKLPLKGRTVVITRPQARAGTLCQKLDDLGAHTIAFPCIRTQHMSSPAALDALRNLADYEWLAITSPQGSDSLFRSIGELGMDARCLAGVRIAAIGPATAAVLAEHGIRADYIPPSYDAASLAQGLVELTQAAMGETQEAGGEAPGKVLLLRAEQGTAELTDILSAAGISYDDLPTYRTLHSCPGSQRVSDMLRRGEVDYITFTSRSTVEAFSACIPDAPADAFTALCIGGSTLAAAQQQGYRAVRSKEATIDSMIEKILEDVQNGNDI